MANSDSTDAARPRPEVAFLFIGGVHHVFHLAPVATELSRLYPELLVACFYSDAETGAALAQVRDEEGAERVDLVRIAPPRPSELAARLLGRASITKLPLLLRLSGRLRNARAVVTAERTSAALRRFGHASTQLIHFRHGAGDRAPKSEKRLGAFDLIVVPGEKDIRRAVERHGIDPARIRASGYVKLDYLSRRSAGRRNLFDDDRPVVLYNPHFDPAISSWPQAAEVIRLFTDQDRYNLVVAPHIRLSRDMKAEARQRWRSLGGRHVIVDMDSPNLVDMTYARSADIYLGDMSSQLYEFLIDPRPAVFFNAHKVDWRNDVRYAGWHLGEVASHLRDVIPALDRAVANHLELAARQRAAVREAFGDYEGASRRGAEIVAEAVLGRS
jgi:hypothetical protein